MENRKRKSNPTLRKIAINMNLQQVGQKDMAQKGLQSSSHLSSKEAYLCLDPPMSFLLSSTNKQTATKIRY